MSGSFVQISLRKLYREKLYAFLNILGLSVALTCCLIISLYLRHQSSYDQNYENHQQIYRLVNEFNRGGQLDPFARTPFSAGYLMNAEFSEIMSYVHFFRVLGSKLLSHEQQGYYWENTYQIQGDVFEVFSFDVLYGSEENVVQGPFTLAISETVAERYFGNGNPIGETLLDEANRLWTVELVYADLPNNTHFKYDVLYFRGQALPDDPSEAFPDNPGILSRTLFSPTGYTYLLMSEDFDPDDFDQMQEDFYARNRWDGIPIDVHYRIEPITDIYYSSAPLRFDVPHGNPAYLYAFTAVAIFIIIIACINYINLATARSIKRAKEVGLRKILGADKKSLVVHFLSEALLYSLAAIILAMLFTLVLLKWNYLNQLLGVVLVFNIFADLQLLTGLILALIVVTLLAGLYPALYLSSWAPLTALVSSSKSVSKESIYLRQILVFIQFVISIAVISVTLLMSNQMQFLADRDLGFDKENQVVISMYGVDLIEQTEVIKNELLRHPDILGVTTVEQVPGDTLNMSLGGIENNEGVMEGGATPFTRADHDFFNVMGIEIIRGNDVRQRLLNTEDSILVVVNEAFVDRWNWDEALGKRAINGSVIGVTENFNFASQHQLVEPMAILPFDDSSFSEMNPQARATQVRYMLVRLGGENTPEVLDYLQERFAEFDPQHPFQYQFLDEKLAQLYESDEAMMRLIAIFAGVCIFVAMLGLFGLTAFTAEQRRKEISIRKILGASAIQVIMLLSKNVSWLIVSGAIVATLIAYLTIDEWMANFAYRVGINWLVFVLATVAVATISFITITIQSWRTARADPVKGLEAE